MNNLGVVTAYETLCDICCTQAAEGDPVVSLIVKEVEFEKQSLNGVIQECAESYPLGTLDKPEYFGLYVITKEGYAYSVWDYNSLQSANHFMNEYSGVALLYNPV